MKVIDAPSYPWRPHRKRRHIHDCMLARARLAERCLPVLRYPPPSLTRTGDSGSAVYRASHATTGQSRWTDKGTAVSVSRSTIGITHHHHHRHHHAQDETNKHDVGTQNVMPCLALPTTRACCTLRKAGRATQDGVPQYALAC